MDFLNNKGVRVLSNSLAFLGEIDNFEELIFTTRLTSFGEFEIVINKNKPESQLLQHGNILFLDASKAGIIEHVEIRFNKGLEIVFASGFSLLHIISKRITFPFSKLNKWKLNSNGENVIKSLMDYNLGNTVQSANRKMERVLIAPNQNRGSQIEFETEFEQLNYEIERIANSTDLGIKMTLDTLNKKFVFDVFCGKDLTINQNTQPPVIFALEYDNIANQNFTLSSVGYKNVAIVATDIVEIKGVQDRTIVKVNDEICGEERREVFVNGRLASKEGQGSEALKLEQYGKEKLLGMPFINMLEGTINPNDIMKYGKDYFLGDTVTMKYDKTTLNSKITEVTEKWTVKDGYSIDCTFGNKTPTLIDKIKQELRG